MGTFLWLRPAVSGSVCATRSGLTNANATSVERRHFTLQFRAPVPRCRCIVAKRARVRVVGAECVVRLVRVAHRGQLDSADLAGIEAV